MKWIFSIAGSFLLLAILLSSAGAQDNKEKIDRSLMENELPWGMIKVFLCRSIRPDLFHDPGIALRRVCKRHWMCRGQFADVVCNGRRPID